MPRRDLSADATWDMSEEEERRSILASSLRAIAVVMLIPLLAVIAFGIYMVVPSHGHDTHLEQLDDQVVSRHPDWVVDFGLVRFDEPCDPGSGSGDISVSRWYLTAPGAPTLAYYRHLLRRNDWVLAVDDPDARVIVASKDFGSWDASVHVEVDHRWLKVNANTIGCVSVDLSKERQ